MLCKFLGLQVTKQKLGIAILTECIILVAVGNYGLLSSISFKFFQACEHPRLAVLVLRNNLEPRVPNATVNNFILSARHYFNGTTIHLNDTTAHHCGSVTVVYFAFEQANNLLLSSTDVVPISLSTIGSNNESTFNPCQAFTGARSLLEAQSFDYFIAIDAAVQFMGAINVVDVFLADRVAVIHPTFWKNNKMNFFANRKRLPPIMNIEISRALHYSSSLFGGSADVFKEICSEMLRSPLDNFHEFLNKYFHVNPPTALLSPIGAEKTDSLKEYFTLRQLEGSLAVPDATTQAENDYDNRLAFSRTRIQAEIYSNAAEIIAEAIRRNYFTVVHRTLVAKRIGNHSLAKRVMSNSCTVQIPGGCGGLGDRFRGVVISLYLAIATGRMFHVHQNRPIEMAEFFELNYHFYNVSPMLYAEQLNRSLANNYTMIRQGGQQSFIDFLKSANFSDTLERFDYLGLRTNRYAALDYFLHENLSMSSTISNVTEYDINSAEYQNYDFPLFISAALRVVFSRMSNRLLALYDALIRSEVGLDKWKRSIKIGIQLRMEIPGKFIKDSGGAGTLERRHILCFSEKVKQIITDKLSCEQNLLNSFLVFITTDFDGVVDTLTKDLAGFTNLTVFYSGARQNLTITHVDQITNETASDEDPWQFAAKTYLDWVLLTKMDYLVITRSSYGETASMMSLKPTWRLYHFDEGCHFKRYNNEMPTVVFPEAAMPVEAL